jgi:hypothetical protein
MPSKRRTNKKVAAVGAGRCSICGSSVTPFKLKYTAAVGTSAAVRGRIGAFKKYETV